VKIEREAPILLEPFTRYFRGFEKVEAVRTLFGSDTEKVLEGLKVEFFSSRWGAVNVNDEDGHIIASTSYIRSSDPKLVYLDLVFALHRVKRYMEGRPIMDVEWGFAVTSSDTDAYRSTVREARNIGMTDSEIVRYLEGKWIRPSQLRRLLRDVGLSVQRNRTSLV
jgi:hypothetical protein